MPPQELSQTAAKVQRSKCVKAKHRQLTRLPESYREHVFIRNNLAYFGKTACITFVFCQLRDVFSAIKTIQQLCTQTFLINRVQFVRQKCFKHLFQSLFCRQLVFNQNIDIGLFCKSTKRYFLSPSQFKEPSKKTCKSIDLNIIKVNKNS